MGAGGVVDAANKHPVVPIAVVGRVNDATVEAEAVRVAIIRVRRRRPVVAAGAHIAEGAAIEAPAIHHVIR